MFRPSSDSGRAPSQPGDSGQREQGKAASGGEEAKATHPQVSHPASVVGSDQVLQ